MTSPLLVALALAPVMPSPEAQLAAFRVADGLQVNLFASEADGVRKPIQMRWDERGRLFVAGSTTYPQITPGARPDDKILILEDADGDGRADRTTVFADDLFVPTGLELTGDGVLVASATELLLLRDTDGDGRADKRETLLSGFGTGDAHQMINSLSWGPGGELWFGQGAHISSRVETPWGLRTLESAGIWRLRPRTLQLDGFLDSRHGHASSSWPGPANPWGIVADDWGQLFNVDGSGHRGLTWIVPGLVRTDRNVPLPTLWRVPKDCGLDIVGTAHLPAEMQGRLIVGAYFTARVKQIALTDRGAGFAARELQPLIESQSNAFRPVDVKVGPDGAIYVADWSNPVIGHYQASYRDPNRDRSHGRIWRVTAKGRPLVRPPRLAGESPASLLEHLRSPERWVRYQAKRLLFNLPTQRVVPAADAWVATLRPDDTHLLYEALGVFQSHEAVRPGLLGRLLQDRDPRARAYATRVIGQWADRLPDPMALLRLQADDRDARVRLEAVVAASEVPDPRAVDVALSARERGTDPWLDHALARAVAALKPWWQPALAAGALTVEANRIADLLELDGGPESLARARTLAALPGLARGVRLRMASLLVGLGGPGDLRLALESFGDDAGILRGIADAARERGVRPSGDLVAAARGRLRVPELRVAALALVEAWSLDRLASEVRALALDGDPGTRRAAVAALARLGPADLRSTLGALLGPEQPEQVRLAALDALCELACDEAAAAAARWMASGPGRDAVRSLLVAFTRRKNGPEALARALGDVILDDETRARAREAMGAIGRGDEALLGSFVPRTADAVGNPEYSEALVRRIVAEAGSADPGRGARVMETKLAACTICHAIDGKGGTLGPDLGGVGAGLTPELIVEALLWPERQIKEGYLSVSITMRDGETLQGYVVGESAHHLTVRDIARNEQRRLPRAQIAARASAGTIMPPGLAAALTRSELLDLIRYLMGLGRRT